jgi:hypothetical protein
MVKHVLWSKFTTNKKINSVMPSKGGTQKSNTKEQANGIAP